MPRSDKSSAPGSIPGNVRQTTSILLSRFGSLMLCQGTATRSMNLVRSRVSARHKKQSGRQRPDAWAQIAAWKHKFAVRAMQFGSIVSGREFSGRIDEWAHHCRLDHRNRLLLVPSGASDSPAMRLLGRRLSPARSSPALVSGRAGGRLGFRRRPSAFGRSPDGAVS